MIGDYPSIPCLDCGNRVYQLYSEILNKILNRDHTWEQMYAQFMSLQFRPVFLKSSKAFLVQNKYVFGCFIDRHLPVCIFGKQVIGIAIGRIWALYISALVIYIICTLKGLKKWQSGQTIQSTWLRKCWF